jgi:hypothetical protein
VSSQLYSVSETLLLEKIQELETLLKLKDEELEGYRNREKDLYKLLACQSKKRRGGLLGSIKRYINIGT